MKQTNSLKSTICQSSHRRNVLKYVQKYLNRHASLKDTECIINNLPQKKALGPERLKCLVSCTKHLRKIVNQLSIISSRR